MKELITAFPSQIRQSVRIGELQCFKENTVKIENILFIGMGGSGIGARIVSQWVEQEINVPINQVQNYHIPAFVSDKTLVIATSYSGNTEETISAVQECQLKGAQIVGISSGGQLKSFCDENGYAMIIVPNGLPPRAALAYSLIPILVYLEHYSLIGNETLKHLSDSASFLEAEAEDVRKLGEEIALKINESQVVIYAEASYESIAIRGKQQFNENGKYICRHHCIPEMNHNELLGWGSGNAKHAAIFLHRSDMNLRNKKRFELTAEIVGKKTANVVNLVAKGANKIEETMYLIYVLDWVSYFLGTIRGEDTIEIKNIDYLKAQLAKI
jgi:glucose/mannose-6-phosphate isomerase